MRALYRKKQALSPEQAVRSQILGHDVWYRTVSAASVTWMMGQVMKTELFHPHKFCFYDYMQCQYDVKPSHNIACTEKADVLRGSAFS